jgi:hypothetical protein
MVTDAPVFHFSLQFFFYPFHSNLFPNIYNETKVKLSPPTRVNPTIHSRESARPSPGAIPGKVQAYNSVMKKL